MSERTPIRVTYIFDPTDQNAVNRLYQTDKRFKALNDRHNLFVWGGSFVLTTGILALLGILFKADAERINWSFLDRGLMAIVISWGVIIVSDRLMRRMQAPKFFSLARLANRTVTNELSENGVTYEVGSFQGRCGWVEIARCVETPNHMLLFISVMEAFVFPRRAFASNADFATAVTFAKEKIHGQTL